MTRLTYQYLRNFEEILIISIGEDQVWNDHFIYYIITVEKLNYLDYLRLTQDWLGSNEVNRSSPKQ